MNKIELSTHCCEDHEDWFRVHCLAVFYLSVHVLDLIRSRAWLLQFHAVCTGIILIVGCRSLLRLSSRHLNVSCSVVCNQGGAANAAEIVIVLIVVVQLKFSSVKVAGFHMHVGCT